MGTGNIDLSQKYKDLLFDVRRSVRYHRRRQGFFRACNDLGLFLVLLLSMGTIAAFLEEVVGKAPIWIKILPSVFTSVIVGINLIFRLGEKAYNHQTFLRRFIYLEQRLIEREALNDEKYEELICSVSKERLSIEVEEPKVKKVLDTICHNELLRAMGYKKADEVEIGILQRLFAQFFDFREYDLHSDLRTNDAHDAAHSVTKSS